MKDYNIETEKLILRKLTLDDANAIFYNWASDEEVSKFMTWNAHTNIDETKEILNKWIDEYNNPLTIRYGIVLKQTNELIGAIDVVKIINNVPEIGYCLSRKYWNNGFMSEACKALTKRLFNIGYKKIVIKADENNIGSNRVIEKCGFTLTHKETRNCSKLKPYEITINCYELNM